MGLFSRFKKSPRSAWSSAEFWDWFQSPAGLRTVEAAAAAVPSAESQKALQDAVQRVNPGLTWGLAPKGDDGSPGEFEIGAGGVRDLIPTVRSLVASAPTIEGWSIVAFKQPVEDFSLKLGPTGDEIDSQALRVSATPLKDGRVDVEVFVPVPAGCPQQTIAELGFIFLDHTLGEYAVMTRLAEISFDSILVAPPSAIPLSEFAGKLVG